MKRWYLVIVAHAALFCSAASAEEVHHQALNDAAENIIQEDVLFDEDDHDQMLSDTGNGVIASNTNPSTPAQNTTQLGPIGALLVILLTMLTMFMALVMAVLLNPVFWIAVAAYVLFRLYRWYQAENAAKLPIILPEQPKDEQKKSDGSEGGPKE